jgi:hypothetical protein
MVFVANNETAEVVEPGKEPLHLPTPSVASKRSAVLRNGSAITPMRRDQFNAAFFKESRVQRVAVVGFIPDKPIRKTLGPSCVQGFVDECYFVWRSTGNHCGERKTMAVCDSHDLAALAAFRFSDGRPPFLAPEKEPSMNASDRSSLPRCSRSSASTPRILANTPALVHCWNRRWHVWYGGYRSGKSFHGAPVRKTQRMPLSTSRGSRGGRPRPPGLRRIGGTSGPIRRHCSFVKSMPHGSAFTKPMFNHF